MADQTDTTDTATEATDAGADETTTTPVEDAAEGEGEGEAAEGVKDGEVEASLDDVLKEVAALRKQNEASMAKGQLAKPADDAKPDEEPALQSADGQPMSMDDLRQMAYTDPLRATAIVFNTMSQPLVKEFRAIGEKFAEAQVSAKADYKRFRGEVHEVVGKMNTDMRAKPEAWERAYEMVRGRHIDELVKEAVTGATAPSGPARGAPTKRKVELTDEQRQIAKKLGVTDEDYIGGMAGMTLPENL